MVDGKGHGIVIRVPAFVGVCQHDGRSRGGEQTRERAGERDEIERCFLVRERQRAHAGATNAGERERGVKFLPPRPLVVRARRETGARGIVHVARRAVGRVDEARPTQAWQLTADTDHFVVRVRGNDQDALDLLRGAAIPAQPRECGAGGVGRGLSSVVRVHKYAKAL